ncbi:hypothetical protein EV359DRAFT_69070 [Lentinula novae-zelandiae]|nr:hypothetical protein EV359DRAFT_69070 [Lentinula novae-zelandiae]
MILSVVNVLSTAIKANAAMVLQMLDKLLALGVEQRAIVEAVLELEDLAATGVAGGDMMNTRGTMEMGKSTKFMMNMDVMVGGGITAPGIVGSDGDDELGLQDAFLRPQRSIRLEIRFQGPQSLDVYGVPASQIIQSGQGKSAKRLKLTDIELLELARQLTLLESTLYQKIRLMEYLQCAREGVGAKDKDGGSGGGMDKESVNK